MESNKKKICEICGRTLRLRCFVYNSLKKIKICRRCHKRIGTNIFYEPEIKGSKRRINNRKKILDLSLEEKQILFGKKLKSGYSEEKAKKSIKGILNCFKSIEFDKRKKERTKKDLQEDFVKGLKNLTK